MSSAGVEPSAVLGNLAWLAARLLNAESAQVSLLTEVQTVVGGFGRAAETVGVPTPLNESLCSVTASCAGPLVLPDTAADDRVAALPPVVSGSVGSYLGVPLRDGDQHIIGALCVFNAGPRPWAEDDLDALLMLSEAVAAELKRPAGEIDFARAGWELAIDAAGIGSFDWNLVTGRLQWDDRLLAMFGFTRAEFDEQIATFSDRIHPEDRPHVEAAIAESIDSGGLYSAEYRIVLPSGRIRWVQARGRTFLATGGTPSRMLGAAVDITEVRDSEARLVRVLESMVVGFASAGPDGRLTYLNAEAERLLNLHRDDLLGQPLSSLFPAPVLDELEPMLAEAERTGRPGIVEIELPPPINAWFEFRASPSSEGLSLYFLDVTGRRQSLELVKLSAFVGEQLARSPHDENSIAEIARWVLPKLGDWALVSVVQPDGSLRVIGSWHTDPRQLDLVKQFAAQRFLGRNELGPEERALACAGPVSGAPGPDGRLAAPQRVTSNTTNAFAALAPAAVTAVALIANGKALGVLSVYRGSFRPPLTRAETSVAVSIALRAGMAVDNARLHREQHEAAASLQQAHEQLLTAAKHDRTVAQALQDALLTTLPEPAELRLAARYLTANETDQVGGDWYDALELRGGVTTLVIGDVVGHDIIAASVMGQLRNLLRALAWVGDDLPAATVTLLDRAMRDLRIDTLATLAMVQVSDISHPDGAKLTWTSAGHPPPMLLSPDGSVAYLDGPRDLLLGVRPDAARRDHVRRAPAGSTLLLYTDGLIESPVQDIDAGLDRLRAALSRHHQLDPDQLVDAVIDDLIEHQPSDDVAVLAVRFEPRTVRTGESFVRFDRTAERMDPHDASNLQVR